MRIAMSVLAAGLFLPPAGARAADPPKGWEFVGRAQAATVDVRPRVTGHLTRVMVREGEAVKKGDVLAEIDPRAGQLDLEAARARMRVAETKVERARITAANSRRLAQNKVVGDDEVAMNAAAAVEAEAALLAAKVDVQRAELTLSWTRLAAPFDGRVSRAPVAVGSLVTADQTTVLAVMAADPLFVAFDVPEAVVLRLRRDGPADKGPLGVAVGFVGEDGFPHAAKLDCAAPEVDPTTGTVRFRAVLPNPKGDLLPGMSARVRLTPAAK